MMIKPHIRSSLSARLSLWIVTIATILFVAVLWIMLWFAHRALEEETTQKALATLDSASLTIDNELSNIETAVRNMRWVIEQHIDYPDAMMGLSRQMVETNPSIEGCNIAFRPDYYPGKGRYFMVYNQRLGRNIVGSDNYSNTKYDEQSWFANTMKTGTAEWSDPSEVSQYVNRAITSYNVPFYHPTDREHKSPVGVISVDIALDRLSLTIQSTRPFPNTYCSVMNRQGSFIIHPDTTMLNPGSLKNQLEMYPSEEGLRLAEAMKNGESGSMVMRLGDMEYYVFYCPSRNPDWSLNIFCPSEEIFESYHQLLRLVIIVTIVGLLALLLFSLFHIAVQLLPLYRLDKSAQKLAEGHFDVTIADTSRHDEIGHLQRAFRAMQQSLSVYLDKITQQRKSIEERGEELRTAYMHVKEEENAKAAFIHSATDQLSSPITEISIAVSRMGQEHSRMTHDEIVRLAHTVSVQTQIVVDLLDKMLKVANDQSS